MLAGCPAGDGCEAMHITGVGKWCRILAREEVLVTEGTGNLFSIWGAS